MNSMHTNGEQDRSLNEALDKLGQSYARLDKDEPPELLDMAILNSAHRAVEKKPHWLKFGWLQGLTTAAVCVLALSLFIHQLEEQPAEDSTLQVDKFERSLGAEPAIKPSSADRPGQPLQASKASGDARKDQPVPGAAAPAIPPREQAPVEALQEYAPPASADTRQQADAVVGDEDQFIRTETIDVKKSESGTYTPKDLSAGVSAIIKAQEQAVVATPPTLEPEVRSNADTQAEAQLRSIIRMKQGGDERWKTELQAFIESHPGYPLPDELKD